MELNQLDQLDQTAFKKLVHTDSTDGNTKPHYSWDEDFQRQILGLILTDNYFACQSKGLIEPWYFSNEVHIQIYNIAFDYFKSYNHLASKIFIKQCIKDFLKERYRNQADTLRATTALYLAEINSIYDYYSKHSENAFLLDTPDAILDKIVTFAKIQALRTAFHQCLEVIKKNPENEATWFKVDEILKEARAVERQQDLGLYYFQTIDERYNRLLDGEGGKEVITSGFPTIDINLNAGGLRKGEIAAWMASAGAGKSLSLVHAAIKNMTLGKCVLYITTEMNEDAVAGRFDSMISLVGKHELINKKDIVKSALLDYVGDYEDKRRLVIKQFPSGTADLNMLKAYHSQLKTYGFKPDLVIVDYLGDLKDVSGLKTYESRYLMLRDLRGFGGQEGHATMTAIHPHRSASQKKIDEFLDEGDIADSYNMFRVFDCLWTLNQTSIEKSACIGKVFISKHRDGQSKIAFHISYGYQDQTLRLEEISKDKYDNKLSIISSAQIKLLGEEIESPKKTKQKWKPKDAEDIL